MSEQRTSRQRGFVLLVVMWLLILLSGIAIGMATTVRTDSRLAHNQLTEAAPAISPKPASISR